MRYKLIIFDIDGTITQHISSWRYIHEKLNLWNALAKKYQEQFIKGKISYRKFCELDAAHWKGMEIKKLEKVFKRIKYSKNVKLVIKKLKKSGFKLAAVSTGLQFITSRVKEELNFDYVMGNRLNARKGKLTGGVTINISHGGKGRIVRSILKRFKVKPSEVIAIGDSEGDIPMVKIAGYSIAFNSTSRELSRLVDFNCKKKDFSQIYKKIRSISRV